MARCYDHVSELWHTFDDEHVSEGSVERKGYEDVDLLTGAYILLYVLRTGTGEGAGSGAKGEAASTVGGRGKSGREGEDGISDADQEALDLAIANRCVDLIRVITLTTWKYLRRGLFVTHKLTVATQLTFKTMMKDGLLDRDMVDFLIMADVRLFLISFVLFFNFFWRMNVVR